MKFQWLGLHQNFESIFQLQKQSLDWPAHQEIVLGLEHSLVVTLGRRARLEEGLLQLSLNSSSIPIVVTDRGGLATLHGPGQLIIYPLISLKLRNWGAREYVCHLLKITQQCFKSLGLETSIDESQSGLFVGVNKICFIGLRISEGRSYHGLSLNVANDLRQFDRIRSCGQNNRPMTSLLEQGIIKSSEDVFKIWTEIASKTTINNEKYQ